MKKRVVIFFIVFALFGSGQLAFAKQKKKDKLQPKSETAYDKLFKGKACETARGLFTIHKMDGKVYFEIPLTLLDREMLLGSTISETTSNWFGRLWERNRRTPCTLYSREEILS